MAGKINSEPVRRPGGRSARVRAAVLAAAIDVLLEDGIDGFSIGEVARCAGIHETSIYRRWRTKANLAVDAVLARTDAEFPTPHTGSLRGDLIELLLGLAAYVDTPLGRLLLQLALRQGMPEYKPVREKFRTERFRAGMAVLARAEERGELRPGTDHRLAFQALIGPLHVRLLLTREGIDRELVEGVVDLVLSGIATHPPVTP